MNEITKAEGYKVWVEREVLFRDLDALAHMNNVTPIYYMEDVRVVYLKEMGAIGQRSGVETILASVQCDYITQAHMGEVLVVALKVAEIGTKSFSFEYLISEKETSRVVCRAQSVSVCFKYAEGQTCVIPEEVVAELERIEGNPIPKKA